MEDSAPITGIGPRLRARRLERKLTLEQAAEKTRIRKVYLEYLEADDYERLPGAAYVTGFLRNYARFLQMDGDALVKDLFDQGLIDEMTAPPLKTGDEEARLTGKTTSVWMTFLIGLVAAILIGLAVVYFLGLPPFSTS